MQAELDPTKKIPYFLIYRNNLIPRTFPTGTTKGFNIKGELDLSASTSLDTWLTDAATITNITTTTLST